MYRSKSKIIFGLFLINFFFLGIAAESFVVQKTVANKIDKTKKATKKSREKACRCFGKCVTTAVQAIGQISNVQQHDLKKVNTFLDGEDLFRKLNKTQVQELISQSEQLEKELAIIRDKCDQYVKNMQKMFSGNF